MNRPFLRHAPHRLLLHRLLRRLAVGALATFAACQQCKVAVRVPQPVLLGDRLCIGEPTFAAAKAAGRFEGHMHNMRMAASSSHNEVRGGTVYRVTETTSATASVDDVTSAAYRALDGSANAIVGVEIEAYSWMWNMLTALGSEEGFWLEGQPVSVSTPHVPVATVATAADAPTASTTTRSPSPTAHQAP